MSSRASRFRRLAFVALVFPCIAAAAPAGDGQERGPRLALFRAAGFPAVDAPAIPDSVLDEALKDLPVDTLKSAAALGTDLRRSRYDLLILTYGSAFPLDAWDAIRAFIRDGGGIVVLGGAPFHQPVTWQADAPGTAGAGRWIAGPRQPSFAHELLIGPAEKIAVPAPVPGFAAGPALQSEWTVPLPRPANAFALTVRLTTTPDLPDEEGSAGPRDAVLRPLAHVLASDAVTPVACPLLEIDRLGGPEAGARWVLAPSDAALSPAAIRAALLRAMEGAVEVDARPVRASIAPGDTPSIRVTVRRPGPRAEEVAPSAARVVVRDDRGQQVSAAIVALTGPPDSVTGLVAIPSGRDLPPGLYHVEVTIAGAAWHPATVTTGFWVRDGRRLAAGPRMTVSRDWIRRDGQVFPVVGTTYMASDVHRKFLFEPNPHLWDRDFEQMRRQGVNFVRTGLWTGWSRVMPDSGTVDEAVLDALEAYVLTAAKHDIVVCFTFFAFLPPSFGGSNPYLDPRALDGQRELLTRVGARFRGVGWIHFDLINEPSYAPPGKLWLCRPIGDRYERDAWASWAHERYGADASALRERWRDAGADPLAVPSDDEFTYAMTRGSRNPRKAADFVAFTQDVVMRWAATLRDVLRASAGESLVTLGQDEGGTAVRPSPQFHAAAVDYTAVHTWWNNDDLLWDGVVTKVPEKPNLVQETGLMRLEDIDGWPWRTPEAASALLERKFAYAIASRGAGAVEWAWNINPYQPIDNEAVIGLIRPDGTAKPELGVLTEFAAFFAKAAPWLDDYERDPVIVVLPHSMLFAGRPAGLDGTRMVIRTLAERFGVVPTALSDLRLTADRLRGAKLVIVSSPEILDAAAARALLEASHAGAAVLVTGAVEAAPDRDSADALGALGVAGGSRPVTLHERSRWASQPADGPFVTFDRGMSEWLSRSTRDEFGVAGSPRVLHEPLPLELAREPEPLAALLASVLGTAGIEMATSDDPVSSRVLAAPRAWLAVAVNESSTPAKRRIVAGGRTFDVPVAAGRARLVLIERATGRVLLVTPGDAVVEQRGYRK